MRIKNGIFYIHGGPGMNSYAEMHLLDPLFTQAGIIANFWNEPSSQRPFGVPFNKEKAFQNWLNSLESSFLEFSKVAKPVHIMASSFGSYGAIHLISRFAESISQVSLINPTLSGLEVQKNIFKLAISDFLKSAPEKANKLEELSRQSKRVYDRYSIEAFKIAAEDPDLLSHYWYDSRHLDQIQRAVNKPEALFDMVSHFAVIEDFNFPVVDPAIWNKIPTQVLFGVNDPVISIPSEVPLLQSLAGPVSIKEIHQCGHFPLIEKPQESLDFLLS